jgi:hypothetical protein
MGVGGGGGGVGSGTPFPRFSPPTVHHIQLRADFRVQGSNTNQPRCDLPSVPEGFSSPMGPQGAGMLWVRIHAHRMKHPIPLH